MSTDPCRDAVTQLLAKEPEPANHGTQRIEEPGAAKPLGRDVDQCVHPRPDTFDDLALLLGARVRGQRNPPGSTEATVAREPSLDCYDISVSNGDLAIVLDLGAIDDATELEPPYAEVRAIAATVLLERNHGPRESDPAELHHEDHRRSAQLVRRAVTLRADLTYDEPIQATEEAAEAVAFLVARRVLNRIAYARCRTRTGADYRLRRPGAADSDSYERLEVSGIGGGTERAVSRLREKLTQLAEYPEEPPGFAIVTNFRDDPVEILVGRHAP